MNPSLGTGEVFCFPTIKGCGKNKDPVDGVWEEEYI